ncbi:MAG: magnesium chelatase subunit D [Geminicoccaceae bacterium]
MSDAPENEGGWDDAALVAALIAVDPTGTAGVVVRAHAGPVRDRWISYLRELLPPAMPWRRLPLHVADGRLLGGLDLAATLRSGRPVFEGGLLAEADGGIVVAAMAERLSGQTAGRLALVLDSGVVAVERDGFTARHDARFALVALDEGTTPEERVPAALVDRVAFHLDLTALSSREVVDTSYDRADVEAARERLERMDIGPSDPMPALVATAAALGIGSLRVPIFALRVARAAAALAGREAVSDADIVTAGRLVLAPRATRIPAPPDDEAEPPPDQPPPPPEEQQNADEAQEPGDRPLEDLILAAAVASLPPGLLARLAAGTGRGAKSHSSGRAGVQTQNRSRGRPIGVRQGEPRGGARINVIETLRAAVPWQRLRRRDVAKGGSKARLQVRSEDFRVTRYKHRSTSTTIFVVDASGSAALHRLAEAKGAVELLLADCYVRRDRVALLAFRGQRAELLLPPTRSLVRAKRSLAGLPGGGGTPLADAIDQAVLIAQELARRGETPSLAFLTDGRANIARDGTPGRAKAGEDALQSARLVMASGVRTVLIDTSPHPHPQARALAAAMGGLYLPLPHADSATLSRAIQAA